MLYYGIAWSIMSGLDTTPLRSILSKMVEPDEFGKVFTLAGFSSSIATLVTSSVYQEIYAETVSVFPGAVFLTAAGLLSIALVTY
jgi:hypothetical protein